MPEVNIKRRVEALEQSDSGDKLVLILLRATGEKKRLSAKYGGREYQQADDETENTFQERVRLAIQSTKLGKASVTIVFLNEIDAAL